MTRFSWTSLGLACLVTAALCTSAFSQETPSASPSEGVVKTPTNLETAYVNELDLRDRYLVYAGKADEEGYGQVASMFRAIARGEEIHASNLMTVIAPAKEAEKSMSSSVIPMSTKENLESAVAHQILERDVQYPRLLEQAQEKKDKAVMRALRENLAAEPLHLAWYRQALQDLDGYKGGNIDFHVCTRCGASVRAIKGSKCEVCGAPKERFEKVR